jgi:predicted CoA-substrate-specific enzyme activase
MKDDSNGELFGGVDVGSCTTKVAIVDAGGDLISSAITYSGVDFEASANTAWEEALKKKDIARDVVKNTVSTGYGRKSVTFATSSITEISCHGKGCLHYFSGPITVVDIGGQDNKVIKLDSRGKRQSFKMNRKCAAGTGAFLEEMALRLRIPLEDLNGLARSATGEVTLGSYCTVFSATEVLEKIKGGHRVESIVKGLFRSVIKRLLEMDTLTDTVVLTGGVVERNPYLAEMIQEHVKVPVRIPPHPQIMGAMGAALYALEG